jgi:hypothetical protein
MADSSANLGYGAILKKGSGSTAAPIIEITDIGDFGISRAELDVTSHDSDDSGNEYIAGLIDGGDLTISGNFISSDTSGQIAAISGDFKAGTKSTYTIILANTELSTFVFTAHVKSWKVKSDLKGAQKLTITFKISGKPTFTV